VTTGAEDPGAPTRPGTADEASAKPGAAPDIIVANAGLVLVGPFLPHFFGRLGLLTEDHAGWRSPGARDRAVHLLQWLVEGRCDRPATILALNRLLCGQRPDDPDTGAIEPSDEELAACRSLLEVMIANWPMVKESSAAGLQEIFLQRQGRIGRVQSAWRVEVRRKTVDVLVDQVPWSFATIFHRWMSDPIEVTW